MLKSSNPQTNTREGPAPAASPGSAAGASVEAAQMSVPSRNLGLPKGGNAWSNLGGGRGSAELKKDLGR